MNSNPTFERMEQLSKEISYHADLYFNKNTSEIPDYKYDLLVEEFNELCEQNPELADLFTISGKSVPLLEVSNEGLALVRHSSPMLGLKKALLVKVYENFRDQYKNDDLIYEYKGDGLALQIQYKDWNLHQVTTRSNDVNGEDVTHNADLLVGLPLKLPKSLPSDLMVRGEAILHVSTFNKFNETAIKKWATPRNAASGWMRRLEKNKDKNTVGSINFYAYYTDRDLGCKTYSAVMDKLIKGGFSCLPPCNEDAILANIIPKDIPVDGIVVKIDNLKRQKEIGFTSQFPKWAIAYKFPFVEEETGLDRVYWNTGKTGRVVPTIHYNPVLIGGVICKKASLDNLYQFLALGLRNGAVLGVTRNGDVIPRISRVIHEGAGRKLKPPTNCPKCGSLLEVRVSKNSSDLYCNNTSVCEAQLHKRCVHFVSKKAVDIDGLGTVRLLELIEEGRIKKTSDILYSLDKHCLGNKVYLNILNSKVQPMWRVINALGLPGIDETNAKKLARYKPQGIDLLGFLGSSESLMNIPGIGGGVALPITLFINDPTNHSNATKLLEWFTISSDLSVEAKLKGCLTGIFSEPREEVIQLFDKYGIELSSRLTADCLFLVAGDRPSESKRLKAEQKGLPVFKQELAKSIEELIKLIERSLSA